MYKLVIDIGWVEDEKVTVESHDFEKITIIQKFILFQEEHGWTVDYEATSIDDFEDTEEEEMTPLALDSKEEL